jgi:outer membrane protein OmpA-like peptidoglycan-associated protein
MMRKTLFPILFLWALMSAINLQAQSLSDSEQRKILKQARNYLYAGEYTEAFQLYSELYRADSTNMNYNYELGITIYDGSSHNRLAAKKHFEKVYESGEREGKPELFYYLGRLYHLEHNFLFALGAYNTYLVEGLPPGNLGKERQEEVEAYIQQCEEGRDLLETKAHILDARDDSTQRDVIRFDLDSNRYISFENLGSDLNSAYDEYGPIIMKDNTVLLYTSRREGSTGGELFSDGQYYEDIYIANFRNGIWAETNNINNTDFFNGALLNTPEHNATVSISPDETQLFTYTKNHCYRSQFDGEKWLEAEEFSSKFNRAGSYIPNVTISPDGNRLYVEAVRHDTYGGRDLYYCDLQDDGTWGELQNLGTTINTDLDEVSPYLKNDTTLFFSSKGHSSIGGWDVFVTHKTDTGWSTPKNLGIPINTPFDEVNYMYAHEGTRAYYSSNREGGYGGFDIYAIIESEAKEIDEEMLRQLEKDSSEAVTLLVDDIKVDDEGNLEDETLSELRKSAKSLLSNSSSKVELFAIANTREEAQQNAEKAKKFLTSIGVSEDRISLRYMSQEEYDAMQKKDSGPLVAKYEETIYFGLNSTLITDYSREKKMTPLLDYLKDKPNVKIYLSGHADHTGRSEYNLELSKKRTLSVEQYLRANGINNPIRAEYFGESSPRFTADEVGNDPSKLIYNRRVKIVIF